MDQKPDNHQGRLAQYPIAPEVLTTRDRTVVPDKIPPGSEKIFPYEISKYESNGYGRWHYGPGLENVRRLDLMAATYRGESATKAARLLNFFTLTDIHLTDKESPAQMIYFGYKGGFLSAYSPVMLYTTHVLDAAVQTVNALHQRNPFDFGISLGDDCNSTQYNELRWFIDVLDGKVITPSTGAHLGSDTIDYQKPYQAAGLDQAIPWYQALGNHDHFWMGMFPPDDYIRSTYTGTDILRMGDILKPGGIASRDFYMGVLDGRTPCGDVIGAGPVSSTKPPKIAADPDRRSLLRTEWLHEMFNTSSRLSGHGFNKADAAQGFACYSFEPKSDLPLKVIVLDDTQRDDDPPGQGAYGHGSLDQQRYDWLVKELDQGQAAGQLMIIAAHIPIGFKLPKSGLGSMMTWSTLAAVTDKDLIAKLHTYPNLIAWVAGHRHVNTITALKSPDPRRPELGFWEIETASLRDFPQQFRTFDIFRNSDNTVSIMATNVDPAVADKSPAAQSRAMAVASLQIFSDKIPLLPTGAYNAELVITLTPEMQAKIKNCGDNVK